MQQQYYAEDGYLFAERAARTAWEQLLNTPSLGRAWVVEDGARPVAYVVLTFGYSLEYHGRDAVLDELFVVPRHPRRGLAREALDVLEAACLTLGVRALHLVVEHKKECAIELYRTHGFVGHERYLMTKRFEIVPHLGVGEA
ncbi:MAG: GNAT family N-acetyltransferase [Gemmatimonadales bacterium]